MINQSTNKFSFLSSIGGKFRRIALIAFPVSIGLLFLDYGYLKNECNPSLKPGTEGYCIASGVVNNVGNDIIVALLGIMGLNLILHEETIAELEDTFKTSIRSLLQESNNVKMNIDSEFNSSYQERIKKFISELKPKSIVRILCLSEIIPCLNQISVELYRRKIEEGCKFQILTISDTCPILKGVDIHSTNIQKNHKHEVSKFRVRLKDLLGDGKIEIVSMQEKYSSYSMFLCTESDNNLLLSRSISDVGYHFLDFNLSEENLIRQVTKGFNILWNKSIADD